MGFRTSNKRNVKCLTNIKGNKKKNNSSKDVSTLKIR